MLTGWFVVKGTHGSPEPVCLREASFSFIDVERRSCPMQVNIVPGRAPPYTYKGKKRQDLEEENIAKSWWSPHKHNRIRTSLIKEDHSMKGFKRPEIRTELSPQGPVLHARVQIWTA
eukprot:29570-Pelagomonas_calceolata.AAC.1